MGWKRLPDRSPRNPLSNRARACHRPHRRGANRKSDKGGKDADLVCAAINDPRSLSLDSIRNHPVYLRPAPHPFDQDSWYLGHADLSVASTTGLDTFHTRALVAHASD
jgi:hypothetical protein